MSTRQKDGMGDRELSKPRPAARRSLVVALLLLGAAACLPSAKYADLDQGTDARMGPSTFYEDGGLAFLAVDSNAASKIKSGAVVPLAFAIANKGRSPFRLNVEGLVLRDSAGNTYPLLSYSEFRKRGIRRADADRRLSRTFFELTDQHLHLDGSSLSPYRFEPLPFYGVGTQQRNDLELGVDHYTRGFIYFPYPKAGLGGVLELLVRSADLPQELFLKFRVR